LIGQTLGINMHDALDKAALPALKGFYAQLRADTIKNLAAQAAALQAAEAASSQEGADKVEDN